MKVLVIPEDPTLDQHILRPVVERIFADLRTKARIEVLTEPHLRGIGQALDQQIIADIIADNRMINLFILAIDRDCDRFGNEAKALARVADHPTRLIACLAHQEVEVWPMALHRDALGASWQEVREHCDPKERFWDPFVAKKGWIDQLGHGRKRAMRDLSGNWRGLLTVCPEIAELKDKIADWLRTRPESPAKG
jgi:hypothetical protein